MNVAEQSGAEERPKSEGWILAGTLTELHLGNLTRLHSCSAFRQASCWFGWNGMPSLAGVWMLGRVACRGGVGWMLGRVACRGGGGVRAGGLRGGNWGFGWGHRGEGETAIRRPHLGCLGLLICPLLLPLATTPSL